MTVCCVFQLNSSGLSELCKHVEIAFCSDEVASFLFLGCHSEVLSSGFGARIVECANRNLRLLGWLHFISGLDS